MKVSQAVVQAVKTDVTVQIPPTPRRISTRTKKEVSYAEVQAQDAEAVDADDTTSSPVKTPKKRGRRKKESKDDVEGNESPMTDLDDDSYAASAQTPKKRQRRKKEVEPTVYDIPPVEKKTTTFKGRLGYACLNTVLRAIKPDSIFCSRTCRLDTIRKNGIEFAKDLGKQNARDLSKLIQWNEENNIKFLRVSSEMFPFASHADHGYSLEYAAEELKAAGDLAKKLGHRLTAHPGQFTQLGSPRDAVVTASFDYHHNWIYPSVHPVSELLPLINETWHRKGIKPKQHLSSPRPGAVTIMEKRAHADRCYELPAELPDDMDLMIEAKDKEQAVLLLYRIYNLHPVIHENLRPEKPAASVVADAEELEEKHAVDLLAVEAEGDV
ncbi:hypothetical protein EUX98_g1369 [Antrodiella citrinella]|uniref:UV-endonuclease UvdE n=1 Tax=Antrodiella citrinella TaxID=2447956 RepID=A0A4S4N1Q3_9APHY|nr:hypothetical protein EUX98_g1369 [Antrodiella citrinella]